MLGSRVESVRETEEICATERVSLSTFARATQAGVAHLREDGQEGGDGAEGDGQSLGAVLHDHGLRERSLQLATASHREREVLLLTGSTVALTSSQSPTPAASPPMLRDARTRVTAAAHAVCVRSSASFWRSVRWTLLAAVGLAIDMRLDADVDGPGERSEGEARA